MIYVVVFDVRNGWQMNEMVFHCFAKNAVEAKEKAKKFWTNLNGMTGKPIHLHAVKSRIQDVKYLLIRGWEGTKYSGDYVMNHVFCTGYRK